ncbi:MAG: glutamate-1-semialdehyde 2,1-aminomutase [Planctomycetota bacterium]
MSSSATSFNQSKSLAEFERACQLMPGGVNSPARAFGSVGGKPVFIDHAAGPYLFDIDGNQYVDYIGSWGPMILGHAHPKVVAAIESAAKQGTSYGAPTKRESELAELIVETVPSIERLRLVNSGTEATMSAIRVARGATGRNRVIKFAGNYHGHVDSLLVSAGSAAATLGVPDSPGVTPGTSQDTMVLEYNDIDGLERAFSEVGQEVACVILEPVVGNMGCVPPRPGFLEKARELCTKHNSVLIFDEVMTGFRVALGGAQERFGVTPDMTTMGKIVGGGLPLGVYGGKAELMDHVLPSGKVFQAGTLSGNPLATAAGIATLQLLRDEPPYERLESAGARLEKGLRQAAEASGLPFQIQRVGSMMTLFFNEHPVYGWNEASQSNLDRFGQYFWGLMERGVYMPCSQYEALFFSALHTDELIDETVSAAAEVLQTLES